MNKRSGLISGLSLTSVFFVCCDLMQVMSDCNVCLSTHPSLSARTFAVKQPIFLASRENAPFSNLGESDFEERAEERSRRRAFLSSQTHIMNGEVHVLTQRALSTTTCVALLLVFIVPTAPIGRGPQAHLNALLAS